MKTGKLFYDNRNPSKVTDVYWIFAERKMGAYPKGTMCGGKWLIFVNKERLDTVWRKIKYATEKGKLGYESKTATAKSNPLAGKSRQKVICVYTYDWTDEADIKRIRDELKKLGIAWKIPYKTDQDTFDGNYRGTVGQRISKYYE
ncbi:MAG: hypothetical protein A3B99_01835 [Candidatus Yanofskybacteria bacterium RIFCSPHIGHO2_02_FULL_44_12b]|uniref:DUF1917 domain-containing protein n=2 Tax=Candidatus Yanofskyibacteriota TaxID=1752733 RepID=A0A1F8GN57_9BACT|nr:MAG: hypothetical protein UW79_C0002G0026 [Candidatus Yanofskybacteria bacterium GW2011_GWA2_44_9]OGN05283.1 MAG: hypothetical protein A2659_05015 [Candidatus Yanofskybacteria bacterium RIFCSPHIGHO2_01_FULL_44_24]OGN14982.1 MAG: hypothetical protein A3B99_01835 [Candidatus Yanofskybacteria bacterium RIFCSPHIGHO2_02_FULL_44_12b]OGN26420.1 MAG: hypothetical protein A2925_03545 [Candidatus Yanofskybacteria bacterium RIFCSPLOWO2_01_FULL_44_22]